MASCEWVIDIIQEWANARFLQPPIFVDRGDPAVWDWEKGVLTQDGAYHDLDVSSIVPANATGILFIAAIRHALVGKSLRIRKKGNVNDINKSMIITSAGGIFQYANLIVPCDTTQIVQYQLSLPVWTNIHLAVNGWWL